MNKVAFYKEEIYKEAARAWKKHIGSLSGVSKKRLVDSGVLDYAKELKGLDKGTGEIARKLRIKKVKNPKHYSSLFIGDVNKSVSGADRALQKFNSSESPYSASPWKSKALGNRPLVHYSNKSLKTMDELVGSQLPSKRGHKLERKYIDAIFRRHEVDEVREGRKILKNKKLFKQRQPGETGVSAPTTYIGSHMSPAVLARESANAAIAPKEAKRYLRRLRNELGEAGDLKRETGVSYGKSGDFGAAKKPLSQYYKKMQNANSPDYHKTIDSSSFYDNLMKELKKDIERSRKRSIRKIRESF